MTAFNAFKNRIFMLAYCSIMSGNNYFYIGDLFGYNFA